ncbi:Carbonic AnHydrase [Chamberlinius hualienensis]
MHFFAALLFTFFCLRVDIAEAAGYSSLHWRLQTNWSYTGSSGPSHWCSIGYDECCGRRQSPIALNTKSVNHYSTSILMENYNAIPRRINLKNNADTVVLLVEPRVASTKFSDLPRHYILDNIHFHWGANSSVGSEHTVDGRRYPLEAHFVHYDSKYSSADEAAKNSVGDGIVVLATLFKISATDNSDLAGLMHDLSHVTFAEQSYDDTAPFMVSKLLPSLTDGSAFFTYDGSFTTPPCTQTVRWVIFRNTIPISEKQIAAFRRLQVLPKNSDPKKNHPLVNNFRPLQALHGRRLYFSELPLAW